MNHLHSNCIHFLLKISKQIQIFVQRQRFFKRTGNRCCIQQNGILRNNTFISYLMVRIQLVSVIRYLRSCNLNRSTGRIPIRGTGNQTHTINRHTQMSEIRLNIPHLIIKFRSTGKCYISPGMIFRNDICDPPGSRYRRHHQRNRSGPFGHSVHFQILTTCRSGSSGSSHNSRFQLCTGKHHISRFQNSTVFFTNFHCTRRRVIDYNRTFPDKFHVKHHITI